VIRWDGPTPIFGASGFQRIIEKSSFVDLPPFPPGSLATYGLSISNANEGDRMHGRVRVELRTGVRFPGPSEIRILDSRTRLVPGQPAHLVATYDGRTIILFINGVQDKRERFETVQALQAGGPTMVVGIGNQVFTNGDVNPATNEVPYDVLPRPFNGLLDEVVLYDQVLPPDRVVAHFGALLGP
jgi:Concanavalin A-like lectin/glucanases superfamily